MPAVPEGFLDIDSLKALDLPNVHIAGTYATGRATAQSDMDILIGLTDAEWDKVTPREPPAVLEKIYSILPEDRLDIKLYKLTAPRETWYFLRGRKGISGVFLPTTDKPLLSERLWKGAVELREAPSLSEHQFLPKLPAVEEGDLECMICHQKFDRLIIGTCESCYKKWTGGKK